VHQSSLTSKAPKIPNPKIYPYQFLFQLIQFTLSFNHLWYFTSTSSCINSSSPIKIA